MSDTINRRNHSRKNNISAESGDRERMEFVSDGGITDEGRGEDDQNRITSRTLSFSVRGNIKKIQCTVVSGGHLRISTRCTSRGKFGVTYTTSVRVICEDFRSRIIDDPPSWISNDDFGGYSWMSSLGCPPTVPTIWIIKKTERVSQRVSHLSSGFFYNLNLYHPTSGIVPRVYRGKIKTIPL